MKKVILIDEYDNQIGTEEMLKAHQGGKLHRAFSILNFNDKKQLLLQQRAFSKNVCPGLWSNTCCGHPWPDETMEDAVHRKLQEEMGFDTELKQLFHFTYKVRFDNGLIEHEIDHVFVGYYNHDPLLNAEEAADYTWMTLEEIYDDIEKKQEIYTPWFKIIILNYGKKLTPYLE